MPFVVAVGDGAGGGELVGGVVAEAGRDAIDGLAAAVGVGVVAAGIALLRRDDEGQPVEHVVGVGGAIAVLVRDVLAQTRFLQGRGHPAVGEVGQHQTGGRLLPQHPRLAARLVVAEERADAVRVVGLRTPVGDDPSERAFSDIRFDTKRLEVSRIASLRGATLLSGSSRLACVGL